MSLEKLMKQAMIEEAKKSERCGCLNRGVVGGSHAFDCPLAKQEPVCPECSRLRAENARLREAVEWAIKHLPTAVYGEAQSDGCDANGAWDCFCDALKEWEIELRRRSALRGEEEK